RGRGDVRARLAAGYSPGCRCTGGVAYRDTRTQARFQRPRAVGPPATVTVARHLWLTRSSALAVPPRAVIRRGGPWRLQDALHRRGLGPVAGVDEVGRGACAGPLVVAACVLRPGDGDRLTELTDSKLLTVAARERVYEQVRKRAVSYSIVFVPAREVDAMGVHVANSEGMRRAVARLDVGAGYVLTD